METEIQYREAVETAVANLFQTTPFQEHAIFRKEGEFWTVCCGGNSVRLKDSKGLGYLAHLLRHPAVEFHVLDLVGGSASPRGEDEITPSVQGLPCGDGIRIT